MTETSLLSPEILRKLLRYEPETGKLFWLERPLNIFKNLRACRVWNARYANKEAFTALSGGYFVGNIFNVTFKAHRVAWALHVGEWPLNDIDHINLIRNDNRWENLRNATAGQNNANRKSKPNSTSMFLGVSWCSERKKWKAQINGNGKMRCLGRFVSETEAAIAYDKAASHYHGEFANLNFPELRP